MDSPVHHLVCRSVVVDLLVAQLNSRTLHRYHEDHPAVFWGTNPQDSLDFGFGDEYLAWFTTNSPSSHSLLFSPPITSDLKPAPKQGA